MRTTRHDPARMRQLLERRRRQHLTWRELSDRSHVPLSTLQYWSKRLGAEQQRPRRARRSPFIELAIGTSSAAHADLEIILENGRKLRISAYSDAEIALRWVRLLEATC